MSHLSCESIREIPQNLARIVRGLFRSQTNQARDEAIEDIMPEINLHRDPAALYSYRDRRGLNCTRVINLFETGEGFFDDDPVDAEKLLEEVRNLTRYEKRIPAKRRKYW